MRGLLRTYAALRRFRRDQGGATLVELAIAMPLFLLLFMGIIDFGRMAFHYVVAERAMNVASRVAAVRPPACAGVPEIHERNPSASGTLPSFGTSCRTGPDICLDAGTVTCSGSAANPTANEIWQLIRGAMPPGADIAALSFRYSYDQNLGFLGGPYVPVVTVELQNQTFGFVSPLGRLAALTGATADPTLGAAVPFPPMSVSLPAEDLALGQNG
ncbi:MAG: TadE/TadG family type IV pilus assembly protein [Leisingera sp.]